MEAFTLTADMGLFQRKLEWVVSLLETPDVRERLDSGLIDRLLEAVARGSGDELVELGGMSAGGAGDVVVEIEFSGVLDEVATALRALRFEFQG